VYCIVDIETTGGDSRSDRITEIAMIRHDGTRIVDQFCTLINPGRRIPYHIAALTGITDEMVSNAPHFYEVARKIIEFSADAVFVAHNASFDYNFIRNEYKTLGFEFCREKICTVRLSRKLIPGFQSYSLGKLCRELGIRIDSRHRALGDAAATAKIFELLLSWGASVNSVGRENLDFQGLGLHSNITKEIIAALPRETGVYYFRNETGQLIYVGKSRNIRSRVLNHLTSSSNARALEMRSAIAFIDFEITGSELIALLKESEEIKTMRPWYNRAQRRSAFSCGLFPVFNSKGYIEFKVRRLCKTDHPVTGFGSQAEGKNLLSDWVERFQLCQKLCGLYPSEGSCFNRQVGKCGGACVGQEGVQEYNQRARQALSSVEIEFQNIIILDKGRRPEEKAIVAIESGKYLGYGFANPELIEHSVEWLKNCIAPRMDNREVRSIIRGYLMRKNVEKIINLH